MFDELRIAEDDNVYIRMLTIRDTANVLSWRNSDYVKNNFIMRDTITEEMHEDWIRTKVNTGEVVDFIIGFNNEDVGCVYFRDISPECTSAEYGIFLSEKAAGKGVGYKASKMAIRFMFDEFDLDYITLRVLEKNKAAIHLYEKCGFSLEEKTETVEIDGHEEKVLFMIIHKK